MHKLSDRLRPNVECAPWVIEEIKKLEARIDEGVMAWESTVPVFTKYITQARYEILSPEFCKWYKPLQSAVWNPTDEELARIYKAANNELEGKAKPLTTQRIFAAMRKAIDEVRGEA